MLNLCANQNRTSMKTTLLVVGRTVEQHFISHQRLCATYQALSLIRDGSHPRTEKHQESLHGSAEGKGRGTDIESSPAGRCGRTAGRRWKRNALHRVCRLYEAQDEYREQPGDVVVLLDEHGKEFRSIEFAEWAEKKMHTVNKRLVFIIGGPYGFSPKVYEAAHEKMSLSRMTFSHQMVRLIFVEQLYRAMTILNGGPYHHE